MERLPPLKRCATRSRRRAGPGESGARAGQDFFLSVTQGLRPGLSYAAPLGLVRVKLPSSLENGLAEALNPAQARACRYS